MIKFIGGEYDLEPADQPPHTLDSKGRMKPSERNSHPQNISPAVQVHEGLHQVLLHSGLTIVAGSYLNAAKGDRCPQSLLKTRQKCRIVYICCNLFKYFGG